MQLSIIIATFNRGPKLLRTLQSLVVQSLAPKNWEAIVVNNNSTDNTAEVFATFAKNHPELNLTLTAEPAQGLSHARNRGISEAKAPIIAIVDDDEELSADFAMSYVDFFARHPEVSLAGGGVVPVYETGRPRWMTRFTERPIAGTLWKGAKEKPFGRGYPAGGNMAIRRCVLDRYGAFDTTLGRVGGVLMGGEEKEFAHRIAAAGEPVWWVPGAVIFHIIPPEKLSANYFRRLSRGCGVSERVRTRSISRGAYICALFAEGLKWLATILLSIYYASTLRPSKARGLFLLRSGITHGLLF